MPPIYGEGWQKALARLPGEIENPPNSPFIVTDAPWIVPFERNPYFTGRETLLAELEGKLFAEGRTSRIAITGLGGIGKTQLVLELLYRTKEKHKDCSIMWIRATSAETLHQGYLEVAQRLEIPGCEDERADVKKLVQDHLNKKDVAPWVLVFDNADDIDMWTTTPILEHKDAGPAQGSHRLTDYLPQNERGRIIFTTRNEKAALEFARDNVVQVPEMSEGAAMELLKNYLVDPGLVDDLRDATALVVELTCLPLVIVQATAFINGNRITLAEYLSLLKEEGEVIELLSEEFRDEGRYQDEKNSAATWLPSTLIRCRTAPPFHFSRRLFSLEWRRVSSKRRRAST